MSVLSGTYVRQRILEASKRAHVGHIGSALSVADIIAVLFDGILCGFGSQDINRDRFVMSKGHAALAVYAALYCKGILSQAQFESYCLEGTQLGTHPEHVLPGIDFSTGSLGQGLLLSVGGLSDGKQ
jgi:transketolase